MKSALIALACLCLLPSLSLAQRVTFADLRYVLHHNIGQVEEYLSNKDFTYVSSDTSDASRQLYSSKFTRHYKDYRNNISVMKDSMDGSDLDAMFTTSSKTDYIAFKSSIKSMGYKMTASKITTTGTLQIDYGKGNMKVVIFISRMKDIDTEYYSISLMSKS